MINIDMDISSQVCETNPTPLPVMPVVAMAYVPFQQYTLTYEPEKGLDMGTIFPELDKPFLGGARR
jgi:hypothetical protein